MKRYSRILIAFLLVVISLSTSYAPASAQDQYHQPADPLRPSYEAYRVDKLVTSSEVSSSGDLNIEIPLLTVPNRLGHDWPLVLRYNSNITQRQRASWVGLGWEFDLGYVERTVIGRSDDQVAGLPNGELGASKAIIERGEKEGRFRGIHTKNADSTQIGVFDQADLYRLNVAGSGTEIMPFAANYSNDSVQVSLAEFHPIQYKPWRIEAITNSDEQLRGFWVRTEDGTQYLLGSSYGGGTVDSIVVNDGQQTPFQTFKYPYRWNLGYVIHPDGVIDSIYHAQYNNGSSNSHSYRHPWDNVQIDRSRPANEKNNFGKIGDQSGALDDGYAEYYTSWPRKLSTETHYALFFVSVVPERQAERACRLDSIVLFEKQHNLRIESVHLQYDTSCNDQQTLKSVQRFGFDGLSQPPTEFRYVDAAAVHPDVLTTFSIGNVNFPGYWCDLYPNVDDYATAWHLDTLILSTGGTIAYGYSPIPSVAYDPEGAEFQGQESRGWGYDMQPRSRLVSKTVTNSLNESRSWTYTYGTALFDWPSRVNSSSFMPRAIRGHFIADSGLAVRYYQFFRGTPLVHRWITTTGPDGSTMRTHFSTSYSGSGADPRESKPDLNVGAWMDPASTMFVSRAGERGQIWKVVQNGVDSTITSFRTTVRYAMNDLYDYYYGRRHFVRNTSIESLPDTVFMIKDGVQTMRIQTYNQYGMTDTVKESGPSQWKVSTTSYACMQSGGAGMLDRWMLSQPYKSEVWDGSTLLSRQKVIWTPLTVGSGSVYLPSEIWQWRTSVDSLRVLGIDEYDGFADPIQTSDANGVATYHQYGGSTYVPPTTGGEDPNTLESLQPFDVAYYTGVTRNMGSFNLTKGFEYTPFGKVSRIVDENGNSAKFEYERFHRLSGIRDADSNLTGSFMYSDNIRGEDGNSVGFLSVMAMSYHTGSTYTQTETFADNVGQPFQTRTKLGSSFIVNHSVYDPLWRLQMQYKPFVSPSSTGPDGNIQSLSTNYQTSIGVDAGSRPYTSYSYDPSGRPAAVWAPGMAFASHPATTSYGTNTSADSTGYAVGTLFKTTVRDENGNVNQEFRDHRGNLVLSRVDSAKLRMKTRFRVDALGRILSVVRPEGDSTTYQYDMLGKLTRKWSPDEGAVEYRYDKAGNLRFSRDANQGTTRYTYRKYDALNRLVEIGEHVPSSDDFTQANADAVTFPTSGTNVVHAVMSYDGVVLTGQHNILGRLSRSISYSAGEASCTTTYTYDREGRVEWIERQLAAFQPIRIGYRYDLQGNPVRMDYVDSAVPENALSLFYCYDELGRLSRVDAGIDTTGVGAVTQAQYAYTATGQVKRLQLGVAQGVDFRYNVRDWVRAINNQSFSVQSDPGHDGGNGIPSDRFGMVIGYDSIGYVGTAHGAGPQYNGNISWAMYNSASLPFAVGSQSAPLMGWSYKYDRGNRLTGANCGYSLATDSSSWPPSAAFDLDTVTYDRNGNIRSLSRRDDGTPYRNNFTYSYASLNRVNSIYDAADGTTSTYTYDGNGNLLTENSPGRTMSSVSYDYRNLPLQATLNSTLVKYRYDAEGNRIWKETPSGKTRYIRGADGSTVAVYKEDGTLLYWIISVGGKMLGRLDP